jgi:hypothetical protein
LLTKRIGNWKSLIEAARDYAENHVDYGDDEDEYGQQQDNLFQWLDGWLFEDPLVPKNIWLGITVCNQEEADRDIPKLLKTPAAKRFLSIEPMLGEVNLRDYVRPKFVPSDDPNWKTLRPPLDWVIVGGETGKHARPLNPDYVCSIRDQCAGTGVPFMFKQWGEFHPLVWCDGGQIVIGDEDAPCVNVDGVPMIRVGKKRSGRLLDGVLHDKFPE